MGEDREWLTEGEIRSVVHQEMRDALRTNTAILERQNEVLDRIADGAQAQILSANILHGNAALGLKGFVPDVLERLSAVEAGQLQDRALIEERHSETSGRLDELEKNQHRARRLLQALYAWALKSSDGGVDYKRVTGLVAGVVTVLHYAFAYVPVWLKRLGLAIAHAVGK